jgi:hypothetical protein
MSKSYEDILEEHGYEVIFSGNLNDILPTIDDLCRELTFEDYAVDFPELH